jgi:hypothetical protein
MTVITDVFKELFSMFVGDARLTIAILALVAAVAFSIKDVAAPEPVLSGFPLSKTYAMDRSWEAMEPLLGFSKS